MDLNVKVLDDRVVDRAKRRELDALVYAPPFTRLTTIRDRARQYSDGELLVVPAREVFVGHWGARRHVLAVGLADPVPDFITLDGALSALHRQDAAVLVPHPTSRMAGVSAAEVHDVAADVHAVEAHNAACLRSTNERAGRLARETGLPAFGSSYAHLRWGVGDVWTSFEREIGSEADLVAALREGAPRRVFRRSGTGHRLRRLAAFGRLGYEYSWKRLDRVFLSGIEPTHPGHIAYDGRFDDVRVY